MAPTGFWDENETSGLGSSTTANASSRLKQRVPAAPIKDDWEDDDDSEEELATEEKNKQIWEDANTKVHHAMPEVLVSASTPAAQLPPSGVFDQLPKMKILKRPTPTTPTTPAPIDASNSQESLKAREARYNAARERIFGSESPASSSSNVTSSPRHPAGPQVVVAREPRGPNKDAAAGFGSRGANRRAPGTQDTPQ